MLWAGRVGFLDRQQNSSVTVHQDTTYVVDTSEVCHRHRTAGGAAVGGAGLVVGWRDKGGGGYGFGVGGGGGFGTGACVQVWAQTDEVRLREPKSAGH